MLVHPATGSILSPNYPDNYPPSTICEWRLSGTGYTGIVLTIVDLEKEEFTTGTYDYLLAYDEDRSINYIHTNLTSLVELVGKNASLRFQSDNDAITFRGFRIIYTTFLGQFRVKYKNTQTLCPNIIFLSVHYDTQ